MTFVSGQHARIQDFFVRGGGSRILNLFYSLQRGSNGFITHFPEGVQLFTGGGGGLNANFYKNPYNYNLWFSRGVWTPYPPLDSQMYTVALWHK